MRVFVGITGASGVIYGVRLVEELSRRGVEVHVSITPTAERIIRQEMELDPGHVRRLARYYWEYDDLEAPPASGSFPLDAVVIAPCSTRTLAAVAHGISDNLITRAAEVALKERRRLVLLIREAPLSAVHIRNMLIAARAGAVVMPASPPFYHRPRTIDDLVNAVVGRLMDIIGVGNELAPRWGLDRLGDVDSGGER